MRQNSLDGKLWYPPLMHKTFRYQKFPEKKTEEFTSRNFSNLWNKKKLTKNVITPLSIVFRYQKHSETPKEPLNETFLGDKKFPRIFCDTPLYDVTKFLHSTNEQHQKILGTPQTSRDTKMPLKNFWYTESKSFWHFLMMSSDDLLIALEKWAGLILTWPQIVLVSVHEKFEKVISQFSNALFYFPQIAKITETWCGRFFNFSYIKYLRCQRR